VNVVLPQTLNGRLAVKLGVDALKSKTAYISSLISRGHYSSPARAARKESSSWHPVFQINMRKSDNLVATVGAQSCPEA